MLHVSSTCLDKLQYMRKPMSMNMAKIYNSHNFIPREMVTLLSGRFFPLSACEIFHYFYSKTSFKMPENVVYY